MAADMNLPVYLINIDRAAERRVLIEGQAAELGIALERVVGVDGSLVPVERWVDADRALFLRRNGRPLMPGEYGCYKSHLKALQQLAESGRPAGLIIEDDISLSRELMEKVQAIAETVPDECVVKLVNHRTQGFRPRFKAASGDEIGIAMLGPQGSAACYLVTAKAARKLIEKLEVQSLPFDMALERSWHHQVPVYTTKGSILGFGNLRNQTFIASRADYRELKLRGVAKVPTHVFRVKEAICRAYHANVM